MSSFPEKPDVKKKRLLFKILSVLLPLIVVALTEIGLILFGYGHNLSLFLEDVQHKDYWGMNPDVSRRYFTRAENATTGNCEPFTKQKQPGTFRIFVLGESTTIGYPYMNNGSFHRWLKYRLMHTFPDKEFEIINLSLTAVNSYTVLDFAREIVKYHPDAVMVYTGHNEYYGALGVGSTSFFGSNPALIRLIIKSRKLRLIQLMTNGMSGIKNLLSNEKTDLRENLMKRMVSDQKIPFNSEKYKHGIEQFKTNMNDLCKLFSENNIPVFLSTLVSNQKDLKPFISEPGNTHESSSDQYEFGQHAYKQHRFDLAKKYFIKAKELDLLRFRAPEAMNKIIAELASDYPVVKLVETEKTFMAHSPHGILGKEMLLEHVHPNLTGYALLSESFYNALKKSGLVQVDKNDEMSFAELRQQMPVTLVDSLKGAYEMMILKEGWPFNEPMPAEENRRKTAEEELAGALTVRQISWRQAMEQLSRHYVKQNSPRKALQVTEALLLEYPYELTLYDLAGGQCLGLNENRKAVTYLKKAFKIEPNFVRAQRLFVTLLKMDRPGQALIYLQYAASNNQSRFSLNELQMFVKELVVIKKQFEKDSTNTDLSNQIAAGYLKFANFPAAGKYVEKTLRSDPQNAMGLLLKKQIVSGRN